MIKTASSIFSLSKNYLQFTKLRLGVYHYHIRKTGGTSLNKAFLERLCGEGDLSYKELMNEKDLRLVCNKR